jgi:hypothetical protein
MIAGRIDSAVASFIKLQIESGDLRLIKIGLQNLCEQYRSGLRLRVADLPGIESSVLAAFYTHGPKDEKVRRWSLNAIAQFGRAETCSEAVAHALEKYCLEPQTSASAIAATFALRTDAHEYLITQKNFPREVVVLGGLQTARASDVDTSAIKVNIETSSPDILRLSLVTIGMGRAPEHIFDPRHPNSSIVKVLGQHDDQIVSQYSIWAICENPTLGLRDLGVPLIDVIYKPANIRSWIYRLIATSPSQIKDNFDYFRLGAGDADAEARSGLALGLARTHMDGIEPLVLDWYDKEKDSEVRHRLLDHIVRHADLVPSYNMLALEIYKADVTPATLKRRMEAAAAGSPLYATFKRHSLAGDADLFDFIAKQPHGVTLIMNNNNSINVTGNIIGSSIAQGGDASTSSTNSVYSEQTIRDIRSELSKAERELHSLQIKENLKSEVLHRIANASAAPSPSALTSAIQGMKKVVAVLGTAAKATTSIEAIIAALTTIGGLLT